MIAPVSSSYEEEATMPVSRVVKQLHSDDDRWRFRERGLWGDDNLVELFDRQAERYPDKTATVDGRVRWTYAELRDKTLRLAGLLLEHGVGPGDPVLTQLPSCSLQPLVHLACVRIGALYVPLSNGWRRREVAGLLETLDASVLIAVESDKGFDLRGMHTELMAELPRFEHALYARTGGSDAFEDQVDAYAPIDADRANELRPDADAPGHVMLSSGTTGVPKASIWSSNNMYAFLVVHWAAAIKMTPDDIAVGIAPANVGSTGYVFPVLTPLLMGATSVLLERWGPKPALELIAAEHATIGSAIPTQLAMMLDQPLEEYDLSRLTRFQNSGAAIPATVAAEVEQRLGVVLQCTYGATDGGVPSMTLADDPAVKRQRTVGRIIDGMEVELRGDDGRALPPGVSGEICWRGVTKSYGYFNQPAYDDVAWAAEGGWFQSGDLGQIDEDGYLSVVGRVKDMILRGGINIFPQEVEAVAGQHPGIREIAIVPVPDERLGERACAVIESAGGSLTVEELSAFLDEQGLALNKHPEFILVVDEMPVNAGGKCDKALLKRIVPDQPLIARSD
jgi:non-ribosomal peptide synthetase component E (peptide arylation enzyme)